jgi:competence protein ComEC
VLGNALHLIGDQFAKERERWVLWLPIGLGLGISIYFGLTWEPALWSGPLIAVMGALGCWRLIGQARLLSPIFKFAVLTIMLVGIGFTAAKVQTERLQATILQKEIGPTTLTGRIETIETFPKGVRVILSSPQVSGLQHHRTPTKLRLRLRGNQSQMWPGDWISVRAKLSPPSPPSAPGAFDFQRQAYFKGLGAVGFGLGRAEIVALAEDRGGRGVSYSIARLRHRITNKITTALPGPQGGLAAALMTGEKRAVDEKTVQSLRDSGLAHLLSISGLHVGLVAGIIFTGIRFILALIPFIGLRYPIKKWAAIAAICGAFAYALIAGATLPTQRAFLMLSIALLAVVSDRRGISMRSLAWAAMVVLIIQPESLLGPSFQMSFAAVMALIAVYEWVSQRRQKQATEQIKLKSGYFKTVGGYIVGIGLTTLVAGLATAPYSAFHFNRIADYSLIANLIAVPVTALWVMPWAVISFALMGLGLEHVALNIMSWGLELVMMIAGWVSGLPGSVTMIQAAPTISITIISIGMIWLCIWHRRWRYWGVAPILVGAILIPYDVPPDILIDGKGRLIALRSEQGGLGFSNLTQAKYTREQWARRAGQDAGFKYDQPKEQSKRQKSNQSFSNLDCDVSGCLLNINQRKIATTRHPASLIEDCWYADVIVSLTPVRQYCPATRVIDKFDLWRQGTHAIWVGKDDIKIETVNQSRGQRPWVIKPKGGVSPAKRSNKPISN